MDSYSFKQIAYLLDLVPHRFLAWVGPVTTPFFTHQLDADSRPFSLKHGPAERFDQRLNVGEDDGCERRSGEDRCQRLALLCVHAKMIA